MDYPRSEERGKNRVQTKLSRHIGGWRGRQPRERPPVGVPANRNSCYVATIWFAPQKYCPDF
jgi:hypothetical protein